MRIELHGIGKRFGGQTALKDISLTLSSGEVHALVGENGAGKSTCLGIAGGRISPSSGELLIDGEPVSLHNPRDAVRHGIVSVHQELSIVPHLTAVQNVFLGQELRSSFLREDRRRMRSRFRQICDTLELDFDPDMSAEQMSVGDQQMLEIMKALVSEARAVFLDEPTAALGPNERRKLFGVIDRFVENDVIVAFVSHNLDEVLQVSDRVTVFRDGALVESRPVEKWNRTTLTTSMIGKAIRSRQTATGSRSERAAVEPAVSVTDLRGGKVGPISLSVGKGEIVGIAGLVGSGRSTLLRVLAGDQPADSGRIAFDGDPATGLHRSVRRARDNGVFFLNEDRKGAGLLPEATSSENMILGNLAQVSRSGFVSRTRIRKRVRSAAERVGFDLGRIETPVAQLSGGNQQKALLARALIFSPGLLLADEPTRGVDIGAKAEIFDAVRELAAGGTTVLMVSSEFEELEEQCSRVYVMWSGKIVAELTGREMTVENMVRLSFGPQATRKVDDE